MLFLLIKCDVGKYVILPLRVRRAPFPLSIPSSPSPPCSISTLRWTLLRKTVQTLILNNQLYVNEIFTLFHIRPGFEKTTRIVEICWNNSSWIVGVFFLKKIYYLLWLHPILLMKSKASRKCNPEFSMTTAMTKLPRNIIVVSFM